MMTWCMRNNLLRRAANYCLVIASAATFSACATTDGATTPEVTVQKFIGDVAIPKNIFVFMDGTRNNISSRTNVRKLFEAVSNVDDPQTTGVYIEGVGTAELPALGAMLGLGMEPRILKGYDFIAQSYRPGDHIFILGFSRGAHQARALAGLLAYAGVPAKSGQETDVRLDIDNSILEIVKHKNDEDYVKIWKDWRPGKAPLVATEVLEKVGVSTIPVEISFLGLWDTVPGSFFKNFGPCKELTDRRDGDRYKSDSYPPIRMIFHAVALDEKRSRFRPILLCAALNPEFTSIKETWFPGAHADIGGGYADSEALPNQTLQWMLTALSQAYAPPMIPIQSAEYPRKEIAHWSIGDWPANIFSHCENRTPLHDADIDPSVQRRQDAGPAMLRINGKIEEVPYPQDCQNAM